jgi:hypothetical protein
MGALLLRRPAHYDDRVTRIRRKGGAKLRLHLRRENSRRVFRPPEHGRPAHLSSWPRDNHVGSNRGWSGAVEIGRRLGSSRGLAKDWPISLLGRDLHPCRRVTTD